MFGTEQAMAKVEEVRQMKDATIEAIKQQYGEATADVVDSIAASLTLGSGLQAFLRPDISAQFICVDMLARQTSLLYGALRKAYDFSDEQMREALDMAEELHQKIMAAAPLKE